MTRYEVVDNGTESWIRQLKDGQQGYEPTEVYDTYREANIELRQLAKYRIKEYIEMIEYLSLELNEGDENV